jgi:hypothetical protein
VEFHFRDHSKRSAAIEEQSHKGALQMNVNIKTSGAYPEVAHKNMRFSGKARRVHITKTITLVAGSTAVLIGVLLLSLIFYHASGGSSEFLITSSPNGTYRVSLSGQKGRPPLGLTSEVRFEVFKNGELFVPKKYLHSGDSFDLSFEAGYPNHGWLRENVLHFYRDEYLKKDRLDKVIVSNSTSEKIRYLRVQSIDKFLLFDVEPRSSMELAASPPRGDIKWVGAEGEFSNGQKIELTGANFKTRKEFGEAFVYYVSITDHGLVIESPQLEKYEPE